MSMAKKTDTELDHIRSTLTDLVGTVGQVRSDLKNLEQKLEQKIDNYQRENRERFDQQDKRFDQLETLIRQLIPSANN